MTVGINLSTHEISELHSDHSRPVSEIADRVMGAICLTLPLLLISSSLLFLSKVPGLFGKIQPSSPDLSLTIPCKHVCFCDPSSLATSALELHLGILGFLWLQVRREEPTHHLPVSSGSSRECCTLWIGSWIKHCYKEDKWSSSSKGQLQR